MCWSSYSHSILSHWQKTEVLSRRGVGTLQKSGVIVFCPKQARGPRDAGKWGNLTQSLLHDKTFGVDVTSVLRGNPFVGISIIFVYMGLLRSSPGMRYTCKYLAPSLGRPFLSRPPSFMHAMCMCDHLYVLRPAALDCVSFRPVKHVSNSLATGSLMTGT
jgi:hypothetical protein